MYHFHVALRKCCQCVDPIHNRCSHHVEACGDAPEEGYTADYVPAATTSLHDVYETNLIEGNDTSWINNITAVMECSLYLGESSGGFPKKMAAVVFKRKP